LDTSIFNSLCFNIAILWMKSTFFVLPCVIAFYEDLIVRRIILVLLGFVVRGRFVQGRVIFSVFRSWIFDFFRHRCWIIRIFLSIICLGFRIMIRRILLNRLFILIAFVIINRVCDSRNLSLVVKLQLYIFQLRHSCLIAETVPYL
jgi:hypothetical protein